MEGSRLYERFFVYRFTNVSGPLLLSFLSRSLDTLSGLVFSQVYSVRISPIDLLFSYQDSFVNMIITIRRESLSVKFPPEHCISEYFTEEHIPWPCSCITCAAFGVFRHNIGQHSFPCLVECAELQLHELSSIKSATGKIIQP